MPQPCSASRWPAPRRLPPQCRLEEARAKGEALNEDQLGKIEAAEDLRRQLSALSV